MEAGERARNTMVKDGYFMVPNDSIAPTHHTQKIFVSLCSRLAEGINWLETLGFPPIWCIIFDEAWLISTFISDYWVPRAVVKRCSVCSKKGCLRFNYDFWAWKVHTKTSTQHASGWGYHRDRENMPISTAPPYVSLWVPLTDATTDNSCIRVLPASLDEHYATTNSKPSTRKRKRSPCGSDSKSVIWKEMAIKAGGILGWSGRLLHEAKPPTKRAMFPRLSLAFAVSCAEFEDPTMRLPSREEKVKLGDCLSVKERLQVIAVQSWRRYLLSLRPMTSSVRMT
ncbi:hypothetical protein AAMO2058_001340600 [Amorphochlora amoebiformis]